MKIEREHVCNGYNCNKKFQWYYIVPQDYRSGSLSFESVPKDKAGVYKVIQSVKKNGYNIPLKVTVHCPYCDFLNEIIVEDKD